MAEVTALKYNQSPGLQAILVATEGRNLKEDTENPLWGGAENNMGRILMAARSALLEQPVTEEKEGQS